MWQPTLTHTHLAAYISRKINALQFARFICQRRQPAEELQRDRERERQLNAARCALDCRTFAWICNCQARFTTLAAGSWVCESEMQMRLQVAGIFLLILCPCLSLCPCLCVAWTNIGCAILAAPKVCQAVCLRCLACKNKSPQCGQSCVGFFFGFFVACETHTHTHTHRERLVKLHNKRARKLPKRKLQFMPKTFWKSMKKEKIFQWLRQWQQHAAYHFLVLANQPAKSVGQCNCLYSLSECSLALPLSGSLTLCWLLRFAAKVN